MVQNHFVLNIVVPVEIKFISAYNGKPGKVIKPMDHHHIFSRPLYLQCSFVYSTGSIYS